MASQDYFPLITLSAVFVLIAVRQVAGFRLAIWQVMTLGAVAVVGAGSVTIPEALRAIDLDVMVFLFGMFVVGEALVESGYLYHLSYGFFKGARTTDTLVLLMLFVLGALSAVLMNDTLAVIGTPLALFFSRKHNISGKLLLLTLCFAVTLGSVASPIGNPQNLLIAIGANVEDPFVTFFKYLALPTVVNLFIAYGVLKFFYRKDFHKSELVSTRDEIKDKGLASLARASLAVIVILIILRVGLQYIYRGLDLRLTYIAVAASLPIIILSPKRLRIMRRIDWHTLTFFAAMFVLMDSVWKCGILQYLAEGIEPGMASAGVVLPASVLMSQLLSNVPFVALYLPLLDTIGVSMEGLMALAAGSTIAGNLLILGAASNVIVIQNAEKRGETITFYEFARVGAPLTALNALVYWAWLEVVF